MTTVTVVVPWRGGEPWRDRAWTYVSAWYATHHPSWEVVTADGPAGPWCKATAVQAAMDRVDSGVVVVADADVITPDVGECVTAVAAGAPWAVPHHIVHRLTPDATTAVRDGAPLPDWRLPHTLLRQVVAEIHRSVVGGGVVVLDRACWDTVPMDARFTGWGQEDLAWGWALTRTYSTPYRPLGPLWHLWHPPQDRDTRTVGSRYSQRLWARYSRAYTAAEVAAILNEPGARP